MKRERSVFVGRRSRFMPWSEETAFVALSTLSFLGIPTWEGIQTNEVGVPTTWTIPQRDIVKQLLKCVLSCRLSFSYALSFRWNKTENAFFGWTNRVSKIFNFVWMVTFRNLRFPNDKPCDNPFHRPDFCVVDSKELKFHRICLYSVLYVIFSIENRSSEYCSEYALYTKSYHIYYIYIYSL